MFINAYKIKETIPKGKLYVHNSAGEISENPINFMLKSIKKCDGNIRRDELLDMDYFISILWGENKRLMADFFGYKLDDKNSPKSNVGIRAFTIREGIWEAPKELTCGEGIILLGEEEKMRREFMASKDLSYYLEMLFDIPHINRLLEFRGV